MKSVALHLPVNSVSFGQVSILLLRMALKESLLGNFGDIAFFPIGDNVDISSQEENAETASLLEWMKKSSSTAAATHSRRNPAFRLWHLRGSFESVSNEQSLLSFYELDSPTAAEVNAAKNSKTYFTSKHTCEVFKAAGVDCGFIPLAFDSYNFRDTNKQYFRDGRVTFNLCGKFEKRKHHSKTIRAWIKKFGRNTKYSLQCAIYNPFMSPEQNNSLVGEMLGGEKVFNVSFIPFLKKNSFYNDYLNSADVVLGMSGGEGWGLPEFHSVALGKHAVVMGAHGYSEWANDENAVLVKPSNKIDAYDGVFFKKGDNFNQGEIFDFDEDDFISACEVAIKRVESSRVNEAGKKLQKDFSKERFYNEIIKTL